MQHRDYIVIKKIVDEMSIGIELLGDNQLEEFMENELLKRALGMTCINVGELVKVVTDETRIKNKDFPWKAVAGMRDITAHRYQTLRMEDVYNTVHDEYPVLKKQLQMMLDENDDPKT
ncbi:MAG: DUF86 domain-containing protein [Lachnospiraceae bacterium]|nr:DUF86 domain-containing protein [Lachnospiraceae bacterium]